MRRPVTSSLAVLIGHFSLYHRGQQALMARALAEAARVVVVLGSAFDARMAKDPFTWEERADMIRLCLDEADRARVAFVPVRNYFDDERWAAAVAAAVASHAPRGERVRLVLNAHDDTARCMEWFPRWDPSVVEERVPVDGRELCGIYLQAGAEPARQAERVAAALAVLSQWLPGPVVEYLRAWASLPSFAELAADQRAIDEEKAKWKGAPYEPQFITADAVVRAAGHVLLVKRGRRPGRGLWALPGGFVDPRERLLDAAIRELREETQLGLHANLLRHAMKRVAVFDDPDRAQRGRTVTHAHYFDLGEGTLPDVKGSDDAAEARWVPLEELPGLEDRFFEDHFQILDAFFGLT